ncbi:hypothetical protein [Vibrio metschnikovii]|uniref:hypothetical protein n=1 Tax=Vibrio metschnikovii TaxID=28172 RepID=UPI001645142A|nr:hypothetical protein [Vibrio metschnikovii]EKO3793224.1 hypothetical protein [Vibrio metschnikovii]MBC3616605.1 hypothetical protein [Vibrio metschnikovii]MBC5812821.1 hypothetical protein [Vibrio metschnikovii]
MSSPPPTSHSALARFLLTVALIGSRQLQRQCQRIQRDIDALSDEALLAWVQRSPTWSLRHWLTVAELIKRGHRWRDIHPRQ